MTKSGITGRSKLPNAPDDSNARITPKTPRKLWNATVPYTSREAALGLAAIGGLFMSGRAMRPVRNAFDRQRTFVADASHELKTPLTLIKADAEVVMRDPSSDTSRKLLQHLLLETDRMNALLSELLLLARLDAGKLAVGRESFDLAEVMTTTADRFVARASAKGIELTVEVTSKLSALGDKERTAQILAILLDNALQHTPEGGEVAVAGHRSHGSVEASVSDTGSGIAPEHLPRIFDRFYRAEAARTREDGGTGLGLAIGRDLARAQGGALWAENAEGGGAVFHLTMPAA